MTPEVEAILKLRVPVIVRLAHCQLPMREILEFGPGSIIELPKDSDDHLELMVNNKTIGAGTAVKVGENFGLNVKSIETLNDRVNALGPNTNNQATPEDDGVADDEAALLAEQFLNR